MPEQFENPKETKLENETVSDESLAKKSALVAEKAATKSTKTVQHFDKKNSNLFSK
jgi:hypothetical protein